MIEALARVVVRHRRLTIGAWIGIAVLAVPVAARVGDVLSIEGEWAHPPESAEVASLVRELFPRPPAKMIAVAVRGTRPVDDPSFRTLVDDLAQAAAAEPYVADVITYLTTADADLVSADRRSTLLVVTVQSEHSDTVTRSIPAFRAAMRRAAAANADGASFEIAVTGEPAFDWDVRSVSVDDARRGELRAIVPTAAVLVLAFGALTAAALPIVIAVFAIACSLAAVRVVGVFVPIAVFVLPIVSMVGLGVGIDYSLFIVSRFREELDRGLTPAEAAVRSLTTAGRAIVTSGLTVMIGFGALLLTPASETRSVGIGGLLVVGMAVALAMTFLPALLVVLGPRIDWPRSLARRLAWYHTGAFWSWWASFVGRHRWGTLAGGLVVLAAVTWPLARIQIGLPTSGWFPDGTESSRGAQVLDEMGARGALLPVRVLLQAPAAGGSRIVGTRYLRGLMRLSDTLHADSRVGRIVGPVDIGDRMSVLGYVMLYGDLTVAGERYPELIGAYVSPDGRAALMDVTLTDSTTATGAMEVVRKIRSLARGGVPGLDSVTITVGGFAAAGLDQEDALIAVFPKMVMLVVIATGLLLAIAFRSLLVPVKAVVMNLLSVAGALGLIVIVFQWGFGSSVFGVDQAIEGVFVVVPVLVFAIVFGLSMDYEVFLLSRMKEVFDRTGDNDRATTEGITATGSLITSAAAIMVLVFGAFAFSRVLVAQLLGFALAAAVLLDATLIRMVLVPAIMNLAGKWNWWPGNR